MRETANALLAQSILRRIIRSLGAVLTVVGVRVGRNDRRQSLGDSIIGRSTGQTRSRRMSRGIAWATRGQGRGDNSDAAALRPPLFNKGGPQQAAFFYGQKFHQSWRSMDDPSSRCLDHAMLGEQSRSPLALPARVNINQTEWKPL